MHILRGKAWQHRMTVKRGPQAGNCTATCPGSRHSPAATRTIGTLKGTGESKRPGAAPAGRWAGPHTSTLPSAVTARPWSKPAAASLTPAVTSSRSAGSTPSSLAPALARSVALFTPQEYSRSPAVASAKPQPPAAGRLSATVVDTGTGAADASSWLLLGSTPPDGSLARKPHWSSMAGGAAEGGRRREGGGSRRGAETGDRRSWMHAIGSVVRDADARPAPGSGSRARTACAPLQPSPDGADAIYSHRRAIDDVAASRQGQLRAMLPAADLAAPLRHDALPMSLAVLHMLMLQAEGNAQTEGQRRQAATTASHPRPSSRRRRPLRCPLPLAPPRRLLPPSCRPLSLPWLPPPWLAARERKGWWRRFVGAAVPGILCRCHAMRVKLLLWKQARADDSGHPANHPAHLPHLLLLVPLARLLVVYQVVQRGDGADERGQVQHLQVWGCDGGPVSLQVGTSNLSRLRPRWQPRRQLIHCGAHAQPVALHIITAQAMPAQPGSAPASCRWPPL